MSKQAYAQLCWRRCQHACLRLGLALLLAACSSARPWLNQPIRADSPPALSPVLLADQGRSPAIIGAVTLSGGGARAAAFGLGVLKQLKASAFIWDGRNTTLMDEMGLISGVSGGSVLATYYAAFGDETFSRFEAEFLLQDFQADVIAHALAPRSLYRISSPWYGRSNLLAEKLDKLYRGKTFADLPRRAAAPRLLVTATDLTTGAPFEFTAEQFALICSDLNSVPLSFAVAASSSVPLLLSPMTVQNFAGQCTQSHQVEMAVRAESNLQARLLHASVHSYLDGEERPFLHLVDGGLIDNLGVRGLLVRAVAGGSIDTSFQHLPAGSVHKIVLVSVNSEKDLGERIDRSAEVPGMGQVLNALVFGAGSRATGETLASMQDNVQRWNAELAARRGLPASPFAADAELYVINVSLRDIQDSAHRNALLNVPTALTILPWQVQQLQQAGQAALLHSGEYQRLRQSLATAPAAAAGRP